MFSLYKFSLLLLTFEFCCFCVFVNVAKAQFFFSDHNHNQDDDHNDDGDIVVNTHKAMDRIINGRIVDITDYPYQVALIIQRKHRKHIICGGALIKPHIVFTAAHCTHDRYDNQRDLSVLLGADYLDDPKGHIHRIKEIHKHPDFSYHDLDHDFAVIVLEKPIEYSENVQNIGVSTKDLDGGTTATASGWGVTEFGTQSKYLRAADLTIEDWDKCQNYFPGVFSVTITKNMLCVKPGSTTTYFGDSGGPLVVDGELVGLVSFGRRLGRQKKTTVFTRVREFLEFVEQVVPDFNSYEKQ